MTCPPSPTPTEFWDKGGIADKIWTERQEKEEKEDKDWFEQEINKEKPDVLISPTEPWENSDDVIQRVFRDVRHRVSNRSRSRGSHNGMAGKGRASPAVATLANYTQSEEDGRGGLRQSCKASPTTAPTEKEEDDRSTGGHRKV